MGMNWTRTSYLFLVVILISVGVTSAYAITITLGADPVTVTGNLNVDGGTINVFGPLTTDSDKICFDEIGSPKCLQWDDGQNELFLGTNLDVLGLTVTEGTLNVATGNAIIGGDLDLTGTGDIDDDNIFFDDGTTKFFRWSESDNAFQFGHNVIGFTGSGTDQIIGFTTVQEGTYQEMLRWDTGDTRFVFTDELAVEGPIQAGSILEITVPYNRLGTATTNYAGDINANNDLLISGSLEVDGPAHFENGLILEQGDLSIIEGTFTASSATFGSEVTLSGVVNLGNNQTAIIIGGVVNAFRSYHAIGAEGGPGADTLDTITGGVNGDLLIIKANTGSTITIPSATGNILNFQGETIVLSGDQHVAYIYGGTNWLELFRTNPQA